jgi:hypothetical protein
VYLYSGTGGFPTNSFHATNYWVDVVLTTTTATLFPATSAPVTANAADAGAVELGVKFRSDQNGLVKAIRFYKGSQNTGTHIGHLWDGNGNALATVTFSNESASGWQEATLSSPVAITAAQTYVVSYYAPNGHYAADNHYFDNSYYVAPLFAYASGGISGGNGVYRYGPSAFPTDTFNATNYWVDVLFE